MRRIIAPSRFLQSIVEGYGVPTQRTELIHNAYHGPEDFMLDKQACRQALDIPEDRVLLLSICRLMIWKGVDGLIRALARLPESHHLYVAGDGEELDRWTRLAQDLDLGHRVHFLGNVPHAQVMRWIRAADVFLLNSSYEGLSHTLLEVMWLGTPAAASAVCGNPELVEDRVNGRGFGFQDVDGIVDAITDLLENPETAQLYVERSREKVASFARDPLFERKERLFLSVAGLDH
jgi:glycosyltransferase involved in cell wall biosynthesis